MSGRDQRVVEAIKREFAVGLQLVERFQPGDHVAHITLGDGEVIHNDGKAVTVAFQRTFKDGTRMRGCYDALWFDLNPTFLFHRGTSAKTGATP